MEYAPCIRVVDKNCGILHVVTISGAKVGTSSDCDILLSLEEHAKIEVFCFDIKITVVVNAH